MRRTIRHAIGALPWGLLGMIGLILAVEHVIKRHDFELSGPVPLNWRFTRYAAAGRARDCKVLCLGTSMVKFGVGARVVEAETGRRTFNFAMSASSLPANYFVLRRALAAGARPAAVLIDCLDNGLEPYQLRDNLRNFPELLDLGEVVEIAWQTGDCDFLASLLLSDALASCKNRFELRNQVLAALEGRKLLTADVGHLAWRNWKTNKGTWVVPRNPRFEAAHRGEVVRPPQPAPSDPASAKQSLSLSLEGTYTKRFLDLAAAHSIQVFFLLPPLAPHTRKSWEESGKDLANTRLATALQAYAPGLVVIEGRYSDYAAEAFYDDVHLNVEGASVLSAAVGSIIKHHLDQGAGSRYLWVALPPYHHAGPSPWLEDLAQTGLAMTRERTTKR